MNETKVKYTNNKESKNSSQTLKVNIITIILCMAIILFTVLLLKKFIELGPKNIPDFISSNNAYELSSLSSSSDHQVYMDKTIIITTSYGKLRGYNIKVNDNIVSTFLGVPYAQPPLGDLRFQKPKKLKSWKGIKDVIKHSPQCIQFKPNLTYTPWINLEDNMSEDCLYLNIWVPNNNKNNINNINNNNNNKLKSVMVWIHGGAYFSGSNDLDTYDGRILSSIGNVIVVSINYRLGALGFLDFKINSAPGNQGMYDQVMALQWIQDNIIYFGGNKDEVTLFGQSAGAISIGLHYLSPLSRKLFKRGILQSGSPTVTRLFFDRQDENNNKGVPLAHKLNCLPVNSEEEDNINYDNTDANDADDNINNDADDDDIYNKTNSEYLNDQQGISKHSYKHNYSMRSLTIKQRENIVKCIKNASIIDIINAQNKLIDDMSLSFGPSVGDEFLPDLPITLMHNRDLGDQKETLIGVSKDEGTFFAHYLSPKLFGSSSTNITSKEAMIFLRKTFKFLPDIIANAIYKLFLPLDDNSPSSKIRQSISDFIGDSTFICPATLFAQLFSENNRTVYFYVFDHRPTNTPWPSWMGVLHFEEVQFVFGLPLRYPHLFTKEEIVFSKRIMKTWTEFAENGKPPLQLGLKWPKYSKDNKYMRLLPSIASIGYGPKQESCNKWHLLLENSK